MVYELSDSMSITENPHPSRGCDAALGELQLCGCLVCLCVLLTQYSDWITGIRGCGGWEAVIEGCPQLRGSCVVLVSTSLGVCFYPDI